ncbi:L-aspartate oxidase [Campylobacterota bacterium]|nr:L-aspartate oxidase [Campylobacterota bacterium]
MKTDVLIIGGGVGALSCALFLPKNLSITIVSKPAASGFNTELAQGGIACPLDTGDIENHIANTLAAGDTRCNERAVRLLVTRGFEVIKILESLGMPFDRGADGELLRTKEAAHDKARILHSGGDRTGAMLHNFLTQKLQTKITIANAFDLLIDGDRCYGASIARDLGSNSPTSTRENIYAKHTIVASGGIGALYAATTNAAAILGELHGAAALKGLKLADMHFTQFHPTALDTNAAIKPLLTEALRGEGAMIVGENGDRFLSRYGEDELSPRDRLSRAIFSYQLSGGKPFLDLSAFESGYFEQRFPTVREALVKIGQKPPFRAVPISPAFHYAMGGIAVDLDARVTHGLFAVGEAACTGAHGANRLASNSLLEAIVFAKAAAEAIEGDLGAAAAANEREFAIAPDPLYLENDAIALETIRKTLWQFAGIVRTKNGLAKAAAVFERLSGERHGLLLSRSLVAAKAIVDGAKAEKTSVGAHFYGEN